MNATLQSGRAAVVRFLEERPDSWHTNYNIMRGIAGQFEKPPGETTLAAWTRELRDANMIESKRKHFAYFGSVLVYRKRRDT